MTGLTITLEFINAKIEPPSFSELVQIVMDLDEEEVGIVTAGALIEDRDEDEPYWVDMDGIKFENQDIRYWAPLPEELEMT